jgi:BirA family biotin operon repressor/biotin-[acetyl-CoA-carboxylase] ligase
VAVARAIDARRPPGTAPLTLKWPNDVLDANGAKLAGLLAERVDLPSVPAACVLGIGVNLASDGLPDGAVGLDALGVDATAHEMARSLLTEISAWVSRWERHDPIVQDSYRATCSTLGKTVRVTLPSGRDTTGVAAEIDADGCLVLDVEGSGLVALSAGDVVHVRRR